MPREFAVELIELKPAPRNKAVGQILALEAPRIASACGAAAMVALDERGAAWSSVEFADRLARWRDDGRDVAFVIGSADGIDASIKRRAAALLQLSALTLPHALARVVLCEQLWRAWSIVDGHPYHRA